MHLTMIASGSQGDVRPYIALGKGLQAAGYTVQVATHQDFASLVRDNGLGFAPLHGNMEQVMRDPAVADALAQNNTLAQAIIAVLGDAGINQRASELGEKIRAEDGVAQAVKIISETARTSGLAPHR